MRKVTNAQSIRKSVLNHRMRNERAQTVPRQNTSSHRASGSEVAELEAGREILGPQLDKFLEQPSYHNQLRKTA